MTASRELRTERLLLRPFQVGDVDDALKYRNDEEFARFLPHIPQPLTRQDAEAFVSVNMSEPWDQSPTFAVVLDAKLIGTVNFEVDVKTRTAMLGYAIGRCRWGHGMATEAASAAIVWAATSVGPARICASTDLRNVRSRRVLEKLRTQYESLRRADHVGRNGEVIDEVVYGLNLT